MFKIGYDVLCVGSATLDNFLTVDQSLSTVKLGDKVLVHSIEKHSGGGATNAAAALSKLGLKVKVLTKLGKDHDAEFIEKELAHFKIKNACLHYSKQSTDFATIVYSQQEKDRIIFVHKGASKDLNNFDYTPSDFNVKWVYLASLMGKSLQTGKAIAKYARNIGVKILFNPSLYLAQKGLKFLKPILSATQILVLNKEEAKALLNTKQDSLIYLLHKLHSLGPETVIITNGAKKMGAINGKQLFFLIPPKVKVVQTAGAGDAFTAGFLAGIFKKYSFEDALRIGQVNALSVIQKVGTKAHLLNENQVKEMIKKYKIKVISYTK